MRKSIKLSLLILVVFSITGCSKSETSSIKIALDYQPNTNHIGIYVADHLGYFDNHNIEIIQSGMVSVENLISSNQADFGFSYSENVLLGQEQGLTIESIYAIFNNNNSGFMARSNKNIKSIKDLSHKTYCGWGTDVETAIVKDIASKNNVDPNTISIKTSDLNFFTAPESQCDFFWIYNGWTDVQANLEEIDYTFLPIIDYGLDFYTPVIIHNSTKVNRDVQKILEAINKGYVYSKNNPKEASDIFMEYNSDSNPNLILNSMNIIKDNINDTGYQKENTWNDFNTFMIDNKIISSIINPYTNRYLGGK